MFQIAEEEATEKGGEYVYKNELLEALRPFMESPSIETAAALLEAEPSFWSVFEQSKDPFIRAEMPPAGPTQFEIDNARQIPAIDCGVASIKLGLFVQLSRRYQGNYDEGHAVSLAYCVTYLIFFDSIEQPTLATFARDNADVIDREIGAVFADERLSEPVLLAYAALLIALGWRTRDPFNPVASKLTERATDNYVEIPNIVKKWGAEAIVTFFRNAQEFMANSLST